MRRRGAVSYGRSGHAAILRLKAVNMTGKGFVLLLIVAFVFEAQAKPLLQEVSID